MKRLMRFLIISHHLRVTFRVHDSCLIDLELQFLRPHWCYLWNVYRYLYKLYWVGSGHNFLPGRLRNLMGHKKRTYGQLWNEWCGSGSRLAANHKGLPNRLPDYQHHPCGAVYALLCVLGYLLQHCMLLLIWYYVMYQILRQMLGLKPKKLSTHLMLMVQTRNGA